MFNIFMIVGFLAFFAIGMASYVISGKVESPSYSILKIFNLEQCLTLDWSYKVEAFNELANGSLCKAGCGCNMKNPGDFSLIT